MQLYSSEDSVRVQRHNESDKTPAVTLRSESLDVTQFNASNSVRTHDSRLRLLCQTVPPEVISNEKYPSELGSKSSALRFFQTNADSFDPPLEHMRCSKGAAFRRNSEIAVGGWHFNTIKCGTRIRLRTSEVGDKFCPLISLHI